MGQSACSGGGEIDLSMPHEREKPWGTNSLCLGTRVSSSGSAASSGSDAVRLTRGRYTMTGGSTLGCQ